MSVFADFRDSGRLRQLLMVVLVLVGFAIFAILSVSGLLLYRIVSPPSTGAELNPESLLGRPSIINFTSSSGPSDGWFFPGRGSAPTVILCHGYLSNRQEVLTLVTALQEHQYNVFLFDFSGHGRSNRFTSLGYRETRELLAAINALAERNDLDPKRFGVWGTSLGGYAALAAATSDTRIRAVVADSVYDDPMQIVNLQIEESELNALPLTPTLCRFGFRMLNFSDRNTPPLSMRVGKLAGIPKLFIQGNDNRPLAERTLQLFMRSPEPREQMVLSKSNYAAMGNDEKRDYENIVVRFLLKNLPPSGIPAR